MNEKPIRVLFVCLGNICRSPMAEAVFRHKVQAAGLEGRIVADSAGTGNWHLGKPPHAGTQRILADNDIPWQGCARQLTGRDLDDFDYIVTMDEANLRDVRRVGQGRGQVVSLMSYAPQMQVREVPDPFYTGGFEEVYRLVDAAAAGLLAAIRREHAL